MITLPIYNIKKKNKEKDMANMFKMGVDQLTTDNPLEARELMKKMKIKEL